MSNYKESASAIMEEVNCGPDAAFKIAEAMTMEHRTLQQNFTRLCFAWIKQVACDPNYRTDDRNRATYVKCKAIYESMSKDPAWDFLPFI